MKTETTVEGNASGARQPNDFAAMFVYSTLDDLGLGAAEFRVYGHLVRRASRHGVAWPSIASMARICRLHPQTVRKSIKELKRRNMVQIEPRAGETSHYILTQPSSWQSPIQTNPSKISGPPSLSQGTPQKSMQGYPCETDGVKGNPVEENPKKEIHSLAGASGAVGNSSSSKILSVEEQATAIYDAYPRQLARKPALHAIKNALGKTTFEELLRRTEQFAEAWADADDLRFCPHPANWFRDERFNDDPKTWRPPSSASVPITQRIRILEKYIEESPANRNNGDNPSDEERQEYRRWRDQLEELRRKAIAG
jgi:hypothetical protein